MYPFDTQSCKLVFKYPEYYRHFVQLKPEKIKYDGQPDELTEYLVDKIRLCSTDNNSGLNFANIYIRISSCTCSGLVVIVTLARPIMSSVLSIFIPTLLLLIIRF